VVVNVRKRKKMMNLMWIETGLWLLVMLCLAGMFVLLGLDYFVGLWWRFIDKINYLRYKGRW
jgi:hypothetical protein